MSISVAITESGYDLLRATPGHKIVYTRGVCGSGHVDKEQLVSLTQICEYVMDLSIVDFGPSKTAAALRLQLDNRKALSEFQLSQIGVYAKLMDGETELIGETLLQVIQYDKPDIVRTVPHVSEFVINTLMGQAESADAIIDMAAYVSIRQFGAHNADQEAHANIFAKYLPVAEKGTDGGVAGLKVIASRVRVLAKPTYGLGGGGDQTEVSVSLDTGAYTGGEEITAIVSGEEYDAENMSANGDTAPDGTLIIKKLEE